MRNLMHRVYLEMKRLMSRSGQKIWGQAYLVLSLSFHPVMPETRHIGVGRVLRVQIKKELANHFSNYFFRHRND